MVDVNEKNTSVLLQLMDNALKARSKWVQIDLYLVQKGEYELGRKSFQMVKLNMELWKAYKAQFKRLKKSNRK